MSFLDKIKSTAGSAMAAVSDAAKDVSDKGKEMTEKARINKAIKAEETKINNLYMIIGQKVFEESVNSQAYEPQFNGITNAKNEIERLQSELNKLTETTSGMNCPQCGAKVTQGQPFCQCCGEKLGMVNTTAAPVQQTPVAAPTPAPVQPTPVAAPAATPVQSETPSAIPTATVNSNNDNTEA